jgi:hypothetical protein
MQANQQQLFVSLFSVAGDNLHSRDIMKCTAKTIHAYESCIGSNDSSKKDKESLFNFLLTHALLCNYVPCSGDPLMRIAVIL